MDEFKKRFQVRLMGMVREVIFYTRTWPKGVEFYVVRKQLIRSITSVGANYYAACRARSRADYKHKLHIVEEECDESMYWMTLLESFIAIENTPHPGLLDEMNQVLSIVVSTLKTMEERDRDEREKAESQFTPTSDI